MIIDLDGDNNDDIVLPVSYYFEKEYYQKHEGDLPDDIDIDNYVAGVLAFQELDAVGAAQAFVWDVA